MDGRDPAGLLAVAEAGRGLHPLDRALVLAAAAAPDATVADLPLGERDRILLRLRAGLLGDRLECLGECPDCGVTLEFSLSATATAAGLAPPLPERLTLDGWEIELRPLDSRDLAAAARAADPAAAEALLAGRAIAAARAPDGAPADALPEAVMAALAARVAAREARGLVEVALNCGDCGAGWREAVDVGAHVWAETDAAAGHLLAEVAALARHYGWGERDILAMPAARRHAYLALAAAVNALGVLAARAFGMPARVRPRLALRFEAAAPELLAPFEAAPAAPGVAMRPTDGASPAARVAESIQSPPAPPSRRDVATRADPSRLPPGTRRMEAARPSDPAPAAVDERVIHRLAIATVDTAPAEGSAPAPSSVAGGQETAAPSAAPGEGLRRPSFEPLLPRAAAPAFTLPVAPAAAAAAVTGGVAAAEPITVTIGRIEVRADPPRRPGPASAPPRPTRAGPRAMSLEDHLARRRP